MLLLYAVQYVCSKRVRVSSFHCCFSAINNKRKPRTRQMKCGNSAKKSRKNQKCSKPTKLNKKNKTISPNAKWNYKQIVKSKSNKRTHIESSLKCHCMYFYHLHRFVDKDTGFCAIYHRSQFSQRNGEIV